MTRLDPRAIRRALTVLERLPPAALGMLAERIIERMDAMDAPGADLEPDGDDCCEAGDDDLSSRPCQGATGMMEVGDPADAECGGDPEPDDDDMGASEDEPLF